MGYIQLKLKSVLQIAPRPCLSPYYYIIVLRQQNRINTVELKWAVLVIPMKIPSCKHRQLQRLACMNHEGNDEVSYITADSMINIACGACCTALWAVVVIVSESHQVTYMISSEKSFGDFSGKLWRGYNSGVGHKRLWAKIVHGYRTEHATKQGAYFKKSLTDSYSPQKLVPELVMNLNNFCHGSRQR